jgi:hypothetical protein
MSDLNFRQRIALAEFFKAQFASLRSGSLNGEVKEEMIVGERVAAVLGGQVVAWVSIPHPATRAAVTDPAAFLAWVKANRPDEIEVTESVRPGTQKALLDSAKAHGGRWLNTATGEMEEIPGVEVKTGEPSPRVEMTDAAEAGIGSAWRGGEIDLAGLLALPASGGDSGEG